MPQSKKAKKKLQAPLVPKLVVPHHSLLVLIGRGVRLNTQAPTSVSMGLGRTLPLHCLVCRGARLGLDAACRVLKFKERGKRHVHNTTQQSGSCCLC